MSEQPKPKLEETDEFRIRREEAVRKFQETNFGKRYVGASLSQLSKNGLGLDRMGALSDWAEKPKNFLVLLGPVGCGKTYICAALAEIAFAKFRYIRKLKERDLFKKLRAVIEAGREWGEELEYNVDDDFFILDDIGSTSPNLWRIDVILAVIDFRYEHMDPTVFTSNLTRKEITEKYDERVTDRLYAKENTIIDMFGMPSMREQGY